MRRTKRKLARKVTKERVKASKTIIEIATEAAKVHKKDIYVIYTLIGLYYEFEDTYKEIMDLEDSKVIYIHLFDDKTTELQKAEIEAINKQKQFRMNFYVVEIDSIYFAVNDDYLKLHPEIKPIKAFVNEPD